MNNLVLVFLVVCCTLVSNAFLQPLDSELGSEDQGIIKRIVQTTSEVKREDNEKDEELDEQDLMKRVVDALAELQGEKRNGEEEEEEEKEEKEKRDGDEDLEKEEKEKRDGEGEVDEVKEEEQDKRDGEGEVDEVKEDEPDKRNEEEAEEEEEELIRMVGAKEEDKRNEFPRRPMDLEETGDNINIKRYLESAQRRSEDGDEDDDDAIDEVESDEPGDDEKRSAEALDVAAILSRRGWNPFKCRGLNKPCKGTAFDRCCDPMRCDKPNRFSDGSCQLCKSENTLCARDKECCLGLKCHVLKCVRRT